MESGVRMSGWPFRENLPRHAFAWQHTKGIASNTIVVVLYYSRVIQMKEGGNTSLFPLLIPLPFPMLPPHHIPA